MIGDIDRILMEIRENEKKERIEDILKFREYLQEKIDNGALFKFASYGNSEKTIMICWKPEEVWEDAKYNDCADHLTFDIIEEISIQMKSLKMIQEIGILFHREIYYDKRIIHFEHYMETLEKLNNTLRNMKLIE